jgi:uncharacterized cupredoxin-like copper-binding protein
MKTAPTLPALAALVFCAAQALAQSDATAFGQPGDPKKVTKTIEVKMTDSMEFMPSRIEVRQGETVRFLVTNAGKKKHEMVIGTLAELEEHAAMMKKHRGMKHEAPYMAHVPSGKTGTIVWQFSKPGKFYYGCLVGHHFEDGMAGEITVVARGRSRQ